VRPEQTGHQDQHQAVQWGWMHYQLLVAVPVLHRDAEALDVLVSLALEREITLGHHLFIGRTHDSDQVIEQEHVTDHHIENDGEVVFPVGAALAVAKVAKISQHCVEHSSERHQGVVVVDGNFLEHGHEVDHEHKHHHTHESEEGF